MWQKMKVLLIIKLNQRMDQSMETTFWVFYKIFTITLTTSICKFQILGIMTAVTITGNCQKNGTCEKKELQLICKAPPLGEIRRKSWKSYMVFEREIYMYSELLPAYVRFQQEKGLSELDAFVSFPKVYKCVVSEEYDTYLLIMEDLRVRNFVMWPKDQMIDLDHELLALRELAKFHAISFAMKDQRPNQFNQFKNKLKDITVDIIYNGSIGTFIAQSFDRFIDVMEKPEHKKLTENFRTRYLETITEFLRGKSSTEFAVIRHGDFWNNNFMFQYTDNNVS